MVAKDKQTTEAAEKKAEDREVDLQKVEPTGGTGGSTVTADDVEEQAPAIRAHEQERHRAVLNPRLGPNLDGVSVGERFVKEGTPLTNAEFDEYNTDSGFPFKPILKGAKVS